MVGAGVVVQGRHDQLRYLQRAHEGAADADPPHQQAHVGRLQLPPLPGTVLTLRPQNVRILEPSSPQLVLNSRNL